MAGSDITVSSLVAVPRVQGNKLAWAVNDPWPPDMSYSLRAVEVWGSTTNDRATAVKVGEGLTDFHHSGLAEEVIWYYWIKARNKVGAGSYGAWYPVSATAGVSSRTLGQGGTAFVLTNGKIIESHAANAATFAIKTALGNDPSAADSVYISFPTTSGAYVTRSITSALSLTVSSGSKLGAAIANKPFRLWFALFDDAGTIRLAVRNCSHTGTSFPLLAGGFHVPGVEAEGGAGAADVQGVFYSVVAITGSPPYRLIGFANYDSGLSAPGTWDASPSAIELYASGGPTPGSVIKTDLKQYTDVVTGTYTVPFDNTIPVSATETTEIAATSLYVSSAINIIETEAFANLSCSVAGPIILALAHASQSNVLAVFWGDIYAANALTQIVVFDRRAAFSTGENSIELRMASVNAGTIASNGNASAKFGAALKSYMKTSEIMG